MFGQVARLESDLYSVKSQSHEEYYQVIKTEAGWRCSCLDHVFRDQKCKHIWSVEFSGKLRAEVAKGQAVRTTICQVTSVACPRCNSGKIVKHGLLHNKYGDLQRYSCKDCNKRFVINLGFEKMHATPQAITSAIQLYFTGESLRNVRNFLALQGVNVNHTTVYRWIGKYTKLMQEYVEKLQFNSSNTLRTDELYLKIKGNMKYLFAVMDNETRFWIAQQIADNKGTSDVRSMFRKTKELLGHEPQEVISDGAPNFYKAIRNEYLRTKHTRGITLDGERHNNKMERMNGEVRDREKTFRGLKNPDTPILAGYQIFHNFARPHGGLNGKTPAEASGIKVEGENKWITLIQNATLESKKEARN